MSKKENSRTCDACGKELKPNEETVKLADKEVCPACIFDFDKHTGKQK